MDEFDATRIKALTALQESKTFNTIGSCDDNKKAEFYQALWTCSTVFSEKFVPLVLIAFSLPDIHPSFVRFTFLLLGI
jgi:hypothetical protein